MSPFIFRFVGIWNRLIQFRTGLNGGFLLDGNESIRTGNFKKKWITINCWGKVLYQSVGFYFCPMHRNALTVYHVWPLSFCMHLFLVICSFLPACDCCSFHKVLIKFDMKISPIILKNMTLSYIDLYDQCFLKVMLTSLFWVQSNARSEVKPHTRTKIVLASQVGCASQGKR